MTEKSSNRPNFEGVTALSNLLRLHKMTIEFEINSFKEYININKENIKRQQDRLNSLIEEYQKKYPVEYSNNPYENQGFNELYPYEDQHYQYNEFYPTTFNNATLLSLYSLFEFNLKSICIILHKNECYKIKLDDLNGRNYIEKSKKYLTLVVNLDLSDLDVIWKEIVKYQQIRNCIVHNNSDIMHQKGDLIEKQPLYQTIKNNVNLKLNEERGTFIISNEQFLLDFSDIIEKYLITIIEKLVAKL